MDVEICEPQSELSEDTAFKKAQEMEGKKALPSNSQKEATPVISITQKEHLNTLKFLKGNLVMTTADQIFYSIFENRYINGLYPAFGSIDTEKITRKVVNRNSKVSIHWMTSHEGFYYTNIQNGFKPLSSAKLLH